MVKFVKEIRVLILICLLPIACATASFPANNIYVVDLANGVCAEYKIIDSEKIIVELQKEMPLYVHGPCDRMVGFNKKEYKFVQNWVRDVIKELKK